MQSRRRRCVVVFYYLVHAGKLKGWKTTYTDRRGARHKAHRHNTRQHGYRPLYYSAKQCFIFSLQSTAPLEAPRNRTQYFPFKVLHSSDKYTSNKTLCTFLLPSRGNSEFRKQKHRPVNLTLRAEKLGFRASGMTNSPR